MSMILDGSNGLTTPNTITSAGATALTLKSGGTTAMTIDTSQNVGIGTASPASFGKLAVVGDICLAAASASLRNVGTFTMINDLGSNGVNIGNAGAGATLKFQTAVGDAASISSTGVFAFNSGYGSVATAYGCRAWVNFNGTGTVAIRASGNVSSITDNGTGNYTVNFTTALVDANYSTVAASGTGASDSRSAIPNFNAAPTTSACRVQTVSFVPGATDDQYVSVSVFR